ncbi:MAG: hypothetical protein WDM90_21630 [Ferruginibacter sp.]
MKKIFVKMMMMFAIAISFSAVADAQFVIKVRPHAPVVHVRPAAPSPRHVWVSGDYVWRNGNYFYQEGYWAAPPRGRRVWVDGHWNHRRGVTNGLKGIGQDNTHRLVFKEL